MPQNVNKTSTFEKSIFLYIPCLQAYFVIYIILFYRISDYIGNSFSSGARQFWIILVSHCLLVSFRLPCFGGVACWPHQQDKIKMRQIEWAMWANEQAIISSSGKNLFWWMIILGNITSLSEINLKNTSSYFIFSQHIHVSPW